MYEKILSVQIFLKAYFWLYVCEFSAQKTQPIAEAFWKLFGIGFLFI